MIIIHKSAKNELRNLSFNKQGDALAYHTVILSLRGNQGECYAYKGADGSEKNI